MTLHDDKLLVDWERGELALLLVALAIASAAVGYEAGSVLAGDPFEPLWLVPILGMVVVVGVVLGDDSGD